MYTCKYLSHHKRCYQGCSYDRGSEKIIWCGSDRCRTELDCHFLCDGQWCPFGCTSDALVCHYFSKHGWCHKRECLKLHVDMMAAPSLAAFGLAPTGQKVSRELIPLACETSLRAASMKQHNTEERERLESAKKVVYERYGIEEAHKDDLQEALAVMGLHQNGQNVSCELVKVACRMGMKKARQQGGTSEATALERAKEVLFRAYGIVPDGNDKVADDLARLGLDEMDPLVTGKMIEEKFLQCWEDFLTGGMSEQEVQQMEELASCRESLLKYERFEVLDRRPREKSLRAWRVLGVVADATVQDVHAAYKSLCFKFHPDKRHGQVQANKLLAYVSAAKGHLQPV